MPRKLQQLQLQCFPSAAAEPSPSNVSQYPAAALPGIIRPGIVHRLDRGTSGLLVVAKNDLSHMRLCEQFKARTVSEGSYAEGGMQGGGGGVGHIQLKMI